MALKERFLAYVELQRDANATREVFGSAHPKTTAAYEKANTAKRQLIFDMERLNNEQ